MTSPGWAEVEEGLVHFRREMHRQHAMIIDALTGDSLDVLRQCVRLRVTMARAVGRYLQPTCGILK